MARDKVYLHTQFHLDPSNRLATIGLHQRYRQTGQDRTGQIGQTDRQRSDSIGRTVLHMVAQKSCVKIVESKVMSGLTFYSLCEGRYRQRSLYQLKVVRVCTIVM